MSNYKNFSPLLCNLYDNKIIYAENIGVYIITVNDLQIDPDGFMAKACVHLPIRIPRFLLEEVECWEFGGSWNYMSRLGNSLTAYSTWQIWTDPEFVREIERLTMENKIAEVMLLLYK